MKNMKMGEGEAAPEVRQLCDEGLKASRKTQTKTARPLDWVGQASAIRGCQPRGTIVAFGVPVSHVRCTRSPLAWVESRRATVKIRWMHRLGATGLIVCALCVAANADYNRQAALDYALTYWDKVCTDGYYFAGNQIPMVLAAGSELSEDEEGFDCAHFVSCCIGSEPSHPAGGLDVPSRTITYGEPGAQRLTDWLLDQGAVEKEGISDLIPGDVIGYDADHNGWIEHVALYMGKGLVTAHSLSRYSEWNPDPTSDFIFLHLPGAYEPPRVQATLGLLDWLLLIASVTRLAATLFFRIL